MPKTKPTGGDVYDDVAAGVNIHDAIADMSISEMEDYFSDADPSEWL